MSVIPATQEAEAEGSRVPSNPGQHPVSKGVRIPLTGRTPGLTG